MPPACQSSVSASASDGQTRTFTSVRYSGKIDIPEIEDKWVSGPVVDIEIVAPESIQPGELVNISLHLHNNKTGHDFPAGPLDLLESWIELVVEDDQGRVLMTLGNEESKNPAIDAPVIYKADWYDRRGLPVKWHNLWDVVGGIKTLSRLATDCYLSMAPYCASSQPAVSHERSKCA